MLLDRPYRNAGVIAAREKKVKELKELREKKVQEEENLRKRCAVCDSKDDLKVVVLSGAVSFYCPEHYAGLLEAIESRVQTMQRGKADA